MFIYNNNYHKIKKIFHCIFSLKYKFLMGKIGLYSYIKKPIFIANPKHIFIGKKVSIWNGARLEAVTNYNEKKFNPQIIIEDNVKIQQNFHCTCASKIIIKKGTLITQNVGIFDITHPYSDINISPHNQDIKCDNIEIEENCMIGMNSVILPGVKLGTHTIVGANSVVTKSTAGFCVVSGSPAKVIKKYNFETNTWEKITQ